MRILDKLRLGRLGLAAAAAAAMGFAGAVEAGPVRVGHSTWVGNGPPYIARDKGYFAEEGVAFEDINVGDLKLRFAAAAAAETDIILTTIDAMVLYLKNGDEYVLLTGAYRRRHLGRRRRHRRHQGHRLDQGSQGQEGRLQRGLDLAVPARRPPRRERHVGSRRGPGQHGPGRRRVFVMTAQPGRIKAEIEIDLPRPRHVEAAFTSGRFIDFERQIHGLIRNEARKAIEH